MSSSRRSSSSAAVPGAPLVLQVQPSRAESARDLTGLETAMQSLSLDSRFPVALELAATTSPAATHSFLLRADNAIALAHLAAQVQSRYPQANICAVEHDPLQVSIREECSAVELLPAGASYLPLRTFRAQDMLHEGVDPLLGVLAAFHQLPSGARAVVQLALLPASHARTASHQRLVVEQVQEYDRQKYVASQKTSAPGMGKIAALFVLVGMLALISRFQKVLLPSWLLRAVLAILHRNAPALSIGQLLLLSGSAVALLALLVGGARLFSHLAARFARPVIADPRPILEKAARPAYQARLRLFVLTPGAAKPTLAGQTPTPLHVTCIWFHALRLSASRLLCQSGGALVTLTKRLRSFPSHAPSFAARLRGPGAQPRSFLSVFPWFCAVLRRNMQRGRQWARTVHADWRDAWHDWREWRAAMRVYHGGVQERARQRREVLRMLVAAYTQYHWATGASFTPRFLSHRHIRRLLTPAHRLLPPGAHGWSADLRRSPQYLSVADLAALWHLPQAHDLANLAHIEQKTARTLPAPPILTAGQGYSLGHSAHAGQVTPVFLPWSCLRQNMLALASTGKGKSHWLLHLALALAEARTTGRLQGGLLQLDMHGDLYRQTLAGLPPALEDAVVVIDLADETHLVGLNPLDVSRGANRDKLVDNVIAIIEAMWPNAYGPRTENILEYACKTLVEANRTKVARDPLHGPDEQYTLLDVMPLVRDASFRHALLEQVHDPFIHAWWDQYFERHDARQQHEYSSSVVTKFSKFASSEVTRRILGQPRSTVYFADLIAQEKLLLINCASKEVGSNLTAFVGAILVGLFHLALAEQARLRPADRRHMLVLIDEFQALGGINYQSMLAELRKYGGTFALATQSLAYLDRLDRSLRATVLANIDHLFAFAMSADDAALLRLDGVEPVDLINLPNFTCYARLLFEGQRLPLFSLRLRNPSPAPADAIEAEQQEERCRRIALRSHLRYARPVGEIDALLLSMQAREALMGKPTKARSRPARDHTAPGNPGQPIQPSRGTRRRGSGKKRASAGHEVAGNGELEAPLIHDLFADAEQEYHRPDEEGDHV